MIVTVSAITFLGTISLSAATYPGAAAPHTGFAESWPLDREQDRPPEGIVVVPGPCGR